MRKPSLQRAVLVTMILAAPCLGQGDGPGLGLYGTHCAACHGATGHGDGPVAGVLDPPARDFANGGFRLVSTTTGIPSDEDLRRVIANGIPGTSMTPFAHLGTKEVGLLLGAVRHLHRTGQLEHYRGLAETRRALEDWVNRATTPGPPIDPEPEPENTTASRARGALTFERLCAPCHGSDGRGLTMPERHTMERVPIRPRDFTRGAMKGGTGRKDLFARIRCGMGGTPMPSVSPSELDDQGVWDLVHFLTALVPDGAQGLRTPRTQVIRSRKIDGTLPKTPRDPRFEGAPVTYVAVAPLDIRNPKVTGLNVQAVHDGHSVVFRIRYRDTRPDVALPLAASRLDAIGIRISGAAPAIPPQKPCDQVLWLAGARPTPSLAASAPRQHGLSGFFQQPTASSKAGTAAWSHGIWNVVLPIAYGNGTGNAPRARHVMFTVFDGTAGPDGLPVGFSAWQRLELE